MWKWTIAVFVFTSVALANVKDPTYDDLEGLDLVEALTRDGKLDSAAKELAALNPSDRYWMATGSLSLAKQQWSEAIVSFAKAAKTPRRQLHVARAHFQLKNHAFCAKAYGETELLWRQMESDVTNKAACEYNSQNWETAWQTLKLGYTQFKSFAIRREQVSLLLELALVSRAFNLALEHPEGRSVAEWLALAELFNSKRAGDEALALTELARLTAPYDVDANLSAAQLYYQRGQLFITAEAFERASRQNNTYSYHTAELYRQLGKFEQATYFGQLISDDKNRLKARMAVYVDRGRYPLIASMESIFSRSSLREDDEVRYAVAYALLRQGNVEKPYAYLSRIQRPELLQKTAMLKKAVLDRQAN